MRRGVINKEVANERIERVETRHLVCRAESIALPPSLDERETRVRGMKKFVVLPVVTIAADLIDGSLRFNRGCYFPRVNIDAAP